MLFGANTEDDVAAKVASMWLSSLTPTAKRKDEAMPPTCRRLLHQEEEAEDRVTSMKEESPGDTQRR